jgi:hypothetical protein
MYFKFDSLRYDTVYSCKITPNAQSWFIIKPNHGYESLCVYLCLSQLWTLHSLKAKKHKIRD